MNKSKETVHDVIYYKGENENISVEVAFQYVNEFHENVLGFCNNIYNAEGGTHLTGFKTMFTNVINTYARELNILKEKDVNFTGADVRNGMTAVVSIKHPDPRFEGQTKTKLDNQDAAKVVSKVTGEEIVRYFDRNLETLKGVIGCAEKAAKIRKTEEKAKTNMLTKQKFSFDSNGKLANCESRDASKCEIFIVEGDSAGGSAKTARNRAFQAILPIRGKILNVEKASIDKVLANAEIKSRLLLWRMRMWTGRIFLLCCLLYFTALCRSLFMKGMYTSLCRPYIKLCQQKGKRNICMMIKRWKNTGSVIKGLLLYSVIKGLGKWMPSSYGKPH